MENINDNKYPHKKNIDELLIDIRESFFIIIDKILKKENPFIYIFETPLRLFSSAILFILIGILLLFFNNLIKTNDYL
jgi:hypothetical protein